MLFIVVYLAVIPKIHSVLKATQSRQSD